MHVARARWPSSNGKTYQSIYLRESFRQDGKVKKRDIANLTHLQPPHRRHTSDATSKGVPILRWSIPSI